MTTLAEIRAKLKEQEDKSSSSSGDNTIYRFWDMKEEETATLRFLPDDDEDNPFFWIERAMFKFPFNGIVGKPDTDKTIVQVPCMEMYGESCPVLNEVRSFFKDPSLEDLGRTYWKKRTYIFQGFVVDNPLSEDVTPDNPIRKFIISPQIMKLIKSSLMDPDMDDMPTDYTHGLDFRIFKTKSPSGYPDYTSSKWARKERPLSDAEMKAINDFGLFNLRNSLPKKPTEVEQKVIFEMFEASVNGEAYDESRWGDYYSPFTNSSNSSASSNSANNNTRQETIKAPSTESNETRSEQPANTASKSDAPSSDSSSNSDTEKSNNRAEDILAMIRARQNK